MVPEKKSETLTKIPVHVAIVMDGNGRWATSRGLPRLAGHRAGTENLRRIIRACVEFGVKYLTIYAFSTENWGRPQEEIEGLLHIIEDVITRELNELDREGVQLRHIGHLDRLPPTLRQKVLNAVELTRSNTRLRLNIAFNYGGRDEIVCAIQSMIAAGKTAAEINPDLVDRYLFTAGIPGPDLIIRTSGEMRVSNFLIWQGAYSEWYFTPTYWPDFDREEFLKALVEYGRRDRRYGRVSASDNSFA
jgi:undecaprenyl diphosphate synthase